MGMLYLCSVGIEEVLAGRRTSMRTAPGTIKNGLEDNVRTPPRASRNADRDTQEGQVPLLSPEGGMTREQRTNRK